jgi:GNAT superfamily N-acetyltransferase
MPRFSAVEPLTNKHHVSEFDCGSTAQTAWLRDIARTAHNVGTSRVYVMRRLADDHVVGYYALAAGAVMTADATPRFLKGVGNRPIPVPVVILARLGVDVTEQGGGLGRALVADALRRIGTAADIVGVRGLLIHAENDSARAFYLKLAAFESSPTDHLHLLLLMKDLRRALDLGE